MKQTLISAIVALVFGFLGAAGFYYSTHDTENESINLITISTKDSASPFIRSLGNYSPEIVEGRESELVEDFTTASSASTSSVVFIQTTTEVEHRGGMWMDWFFQPRSQTQAGSGSGVIMSNDGYIVTNNHVIDGADVIKVIHGKNTYKGILVGTDPSTDIAVIKVDAEGLPQISIGNSGSVKVGEWVLAVGNPFNLESTVTAGIVSAKGRNINILKDKFPIESFIQTDAAINPGNSGGALVNIKGDLIGINTAILSRTGSYAGYGFAVPVDIVKKVFNDIKTYGQVQKAFIGADYIDIDSEMARKLELKDISGVYVSYTQEGSAADKAGIRKGDVIKSVNNIDIRHKGYIEEIIGNSDPGDVLNITVERDNKVLSKTVVLTNKEGTTDFLRDDSYFSEYLGAKFAIAPKVERDLYGIKSGIKVLKVSKDGYFRQLDIPRNFIITAVNGVSIDSPEEFEEIFKKINNENLRGSINISVITENGRRLRYPFRF
ncbi:MAG: trypsin-like peptidase domain-containing protein [Cyclobacteriaceae bacterium]